MNRILYGAEPDGANLLKRDARIEFYDYDYDHERNAEPSDLLASTLLVSASLAFTLLLGVALGTDAAKSTGEPRVYVDRKGMTLYAIDGNGKVAAKYPVGIGKGPLWVPKRSMSDNITPTGEFKVELILSKNAEFNAIESSFQKKYQTTPKFLNLINSKAKLGQLLKNMNSIDFNRDGKPDNAYGSGYIGLTSRTAVTGPKMRMHQCAHVPYWYSIAIHGTTEPDKALRRATSGGCLHLGEDGLVKLIGEKFVKVGTRVTIADAPPS